MFLIVSDCRIEDVDGIIVPNNKQVKVQLVAPVLSIDERVTAHGTRAEEKNVEVCIHIFVKTRGEEACGIAFWCCDDPTCVELSRSSQAAAQALGLQLHAVQASSDRDFDAVFDRLIQLRAGALVIGPDNLFTIHKEQLAKLTVRLRSTNIASSPLLAV